MKTINVLGVCNGQGIGLFPFLSSGKYKVLGNIEPRAVYHSPKEEQWKANFGTLPFIRNLDSTLLDDERVDVIIGNPSCGGNSVLRLSRNKQFKTNEKVRTEKTLQMFIDRVNEFKPKAFLMENLPRLLEAIPMDNWEKGIFPGYDLKFIQGSISVFGNSQISRKRLVIIGVKKTSIHFDIGMFNIFQVCRLKSTRRLIDTGIEATGNIFEDPTKTLSMFDPRDRDKKKLTVEEIKDLWTTDFYDQFKWPWVNSKGGNGTLPGVYRNNHHRYPMTARKSERQFQPNGFPMTPRHLARIQGIPDKYIIHIDLNKKQYWLNKGRLAVTQTFPYEIAEWFKQCLDKV